MTTPYYLGYRDGLAGRHEYSSDDNWAGWQRDEYEDGYRAGGAAERECALDMVSEGRYPQTPRTRWLAGGGW